MTDTNKSKDIKYVITIELPDGKNYWSGTQEIPIPTKTDGAQIMVTDIWSVWRNQIYPRGVFDTYEEANYYKNNYIDLKHTSVEMIEHNYKQYFAYHGIKVWKQLLHKFGIRNKYFGIDLFAEIKEPEVKKSRIANAETNLRKASRKFHK